MRAWTRTTATILCGNCGAVLERGSPIETISVHGMTRVLKRGPCCAGTEQPADLPELVEPPAVSVPIAFGPPPSPMVPLAKILDWKQKQLGDEE